jgi:hypothetical protein
MLVPGTIKCWVKTTVDVRYQASEIHQGCRQDVKEHGTRQSRDVEGASYKTEERVGPGGLF